jgi:hypothetical protein
MVFARHAPIMLAPMILRPIDRALASAQLSARH